MVAMLVWSWVGLAEAREVRICGQWTPDLEEAKRPDLDGVDKNGDGIADNDKADRLTDNTPLAAHGLTYYAESRLPGGGSWSFLSAGYLAVRGSNGGCTPLLTVPTSFAGTAEVRLTVYSSFTAGGSSMAVYDNTTSQALGEATSTVFTVTTLSGERAEVHLGSGDPRIDTAIIVAWALDRQNGGTSDLGYDIYTELTGGGQGGHRYADRQLLVGNASSVRRILHELGHAVSANMPGMGVTADGSSAWERDYSWKNINHRSDTPPHVLLVAADSVCDVPDDHVPTLAFSDRHFASSDEATSAAIVEAMANYYVAQTVNRLDEGDCFMRGNQDWDHNGLRDENTAPDDADSKWYDCDLVPRPLSMMEPGTPVDDADYWDAVCEQSLGYPANQTEQLSIASEYDWLRGFWDLDTDEGLSFRDIGRIFAGAAPHNWLPSPVVPLSAPSSDLPWRRMESGALGEGLGSAWMSQAAANGMQR